jgi:hypothetical protein
MTTEEILEIKKIIVEHNGFGRITWAELETAGGLSSAEVCERGKMTITSILCSSCRYEPIYHTDWTKLKIDYKNFSMDRNKHYVILKDDSEKYSVLASLEVDYFLENHYLGALKSIKHDVKLGENYILEL